MTVPLRAVADVLVSNVDKKTVDGDAPVRLCNYTDVYYNRRLTQSREYMAATATPAQKRAFGLRVGDSVITKDSETAADIGVVALVAETAPDFVCGYHLAIIRPRTSIAPSFLHWQLTGQAVREQLSVRATGVTRFGLTYDAIRGIELRVPDTDEQRRIADFLNEQIELLDATSVAAGETAGAATARLESVRQAVVDLLLTAPRVRLGSLFRFFEDGDWIEAPHVTGQGIRFLQTGNIGTGQLRLESKKYISADSFRELACRWVLPGDVLISRLGSPVSRAALVPADFAPAVTSVDVVIARGSEVSPRFLVHYLSTRAHLEPTNMLARGATMQRLSRSQLASLRIPVPDAATQTLVVLRLDEAVALTDAAVEAAVAVRTLLEERKSALITSCINGDFDVTTASCRAAEAALSGVPLAG